MVDRIKVWCQQGRSNVGSNELTRKLQASSVGRIRVSRLINGKTDVLPAMALKLSKVLGRSPESWLSMQDNFDLWHARQEIDLDNYEPLAFAG